MPHASAQPARKVTIAVLSTGKSNEDDPLGVAFFTQMRRLGWQEGQNVVYQRYFSEGSRERLTEIAAAAASRKPDLIYAVNGATASAAKNATNTIPIIFVTVSDPIAGGLIDSLSRPGGNATGIVHMGSDTVSKRLELVREALPRVQRIGLLLDTRSMDYAHQRREHEEALRPKGLAIFIAEFSRFDEVPGILSRLKQDGVTAVTMNPSFTLGGHRQELIQLTLRQGLALIGYRAEWAQSGALFSYGADLAETYQRSAEIAHRVLKGARPAETPVERASKFELLVNARTAQTLGIQLPKTFLARADRVIE